MSSLAIMSSYLKDTKMKIVVSLLYEDEEVLCERIKKIKKDIKPLIPNGNIKSKFFDEFDLNCLDSKKFPQVSFRILEILNNTKNNYYVLFSVFSNINDTEVIKNKYLSKGVSEIIRFIYSKEISSFPYNLIFPKNYNKKQISNSKLQISIEENIGISVLSSCKYEKIESNYALKLLNLYKYHIIHQLKIDEYYTGKDMIILVES